MELFKLFHNKIFKIGMLAATGLVFLYFWFAEVGAEIATVDGKFYSGYEAVQMNRKITEEFEGDLTDEKVNLIIEKYGLPTKLEENMPGWRDGNFLNDFVTRYFTNGTWERGVLPTEKYSLKETELGKAYDEIGKTPYLAYTTGWKVFVEMLQFGLILGSILIICGVSTIFAEESQTKMLPLIFSTEEGRRKDVPAKILASFTFTIFIFMWFVLVNLAAGTDKFEDMIKSIDYGLYCKKMEGGSVYPQTGEFNFTVGEAYIIEKGQLKDVVSGITLIGKGQDILKEVEMVSDDLYLEPGYCISASGGVPVTVGEPTIKVSKILVGGTDK